MGGKGRAAGFLRKLLAFAGPGYLVEVPVLLLKVKNRGLFKISSLGMPGWGQRTVAYPVGWPV